MFSLHRKSVTLAVATLAAACVPAVRAEVTDSGPCADVGADPSDRPCAVEPDSAAADRGVVPVDTSTDMVTIADAGSDQEDGPICVDIDVATYSRACVTSTDCILIAGGEVCNGGCGCANTTVSASEQSRYRAALGSLILGACGCPGEPNPVCLDKVCNLLLPSAEPQAIDASSD